MKLPSGVDNVSFRPFASHSHLTAKFVVTCLKPYEMFAIGKKFLSSSKPDFTYPSDHEVFDYFKNI